MDSIEKALEGRLPLSDVAYLRVRDPNECIAARLSFGAMDVYIVVHPDDDTLSITAFPPDSPDEGQWCRAPAPWQAALGKPILWYWWMVNNQGYRDAFQIEFARDVEDVSICVQLVAIASRLSVREVRYVE